MSVDLTPVPLRRRNRQRDPMLISSVDCYQFDEEVIHDTQTTTNGLEAVSSPDSNRTRSESSSPSPNSPAPLTAAVNINNNNNNSGSSIHKNSFLASSPNNTLSPPVSNRNHIILGMRRQTPPTPPPLNNQQHHQQPPQPPQQLKEQNTSPTSIRTPPAVASSAEMRKVREMLEYLEGEILPWCLANMYKDKPDPNEVEQMEYKLDRIHLNTQFLISTINFPK